MSHLFVFCFRVFQRGVSVEEFWDNKSCGNRVWDTSWEYRDLRGAKVYHIWDGANVSRRSITNGGVPGDLGVPAPYPPIYFATLSSGDSSIPRSIIIWPTRYLFAGGRMTR
jgi:hypothetical protein